ncbi:bifunctional 4-hydroxy-2-oxoglutarate aldolase/2-dehydro-3-deoxy-phosphogluconate aldolase [Plantactinospora sp. KLBMP9567]|uniref:bifunctional 4-hydroxy-2-oxoglutarate aldolase/2-dehydro-3-deoxy-phosphogluconate aldolase n=1 Tax=Plantactinospora sp. KLBMP9567 TaxID=3085900 RepID=UPI002981C9C8|nr:bifunctional 4-hydroxy-2-oxoglutarate aldolase/2-dehydro-3-deoxy-phosphogluconate aldolase [Plantactinospora sp. KLBMP9567]MDW5329772.1 bifunctional 4-hydroxy-2-oxoglutarate aldolase/2-dehydro-3-deoxy-phosphogluconate aldolase [Plantactinospora sp. KLBMP9567]
MTSVQHDEQTAGVTETISTTRILPVVVLEDAGSAPALAAALTEGGLRAIEVTFRTAAAADAIRLMAERPDLLVGAGTVLTPAQVDQAAEAGARFVVSPGFSPAVVRHCQRRGLPVFPGAATATEIQMALDAGLDTVKFFPAEQLGGVGMVKALAAPFRSVRFIPTGGVNTGNLADYLALPAVLAVGGTWMVAPALLAEGRWDEVTRLTAAAVEASRSAG